MKIKSLPVPHIQQSSSSSCGAATLAMIYSYNNYKRNEEEIWSSIKKPRPSVPGEYYIETLDLIKDAKANGFFSVCGRMDLEDVDLIKRHISYFINNSVPFIACKQWTNPVLGHFVVVYGISNDYIKIKDPELKNASKIKIKKFVNEWMATGAEVTGGIFILVVPESKKSAINHKMNGINWL